MGSEMCIRDSCNDALRVKVLEKNGHTDVDLMELPNAMTKQEAVQYLIAMNFAAGRASVQSALESEIDKRTDKPKRAKAAPAAEITVPAVEITAPAEDALI